MGGCQQLKADSSCGASHEREGANEQPEVHDSHLINQINTELALRISFANVVSNYRRAFRQCGRQTETK